MLSTVTVQFKAGLGIFERIADLGIDASNALTRQLRSTAERSRLCGKDLSLPESILVVAVK